jgi:hypothetical protein
LLHAGFGRREASTDGRHWRHDLRLDIKLGDWKSAMRSLPALNAVGDLVLTDHPAATRVLAAPLSLSLHDELRRGGPATADELASRIQADPHTTQQRLRQLEAVGLATSGEPVVDREQARWHACGKGVFFEIPDDPDGAAAARLLSNAMILRYVDLPTRWVAEHEPQLSLDWARAAGSSMPA